MKLDTSVDFDNTEIIQSFSVLILKFHLRKDEGIIKNIGGANCSITKSITCIATAFNRRSSVAILQTIFFAENF